MVGTGRLSIVIAKSLSVGRLKFMIPALES